ncbi:MAG: tetraacyldisaccharide 4'-kinase [Pseudomonadota bacterium]
MRAVLERWLLARWFGRPGILWLLLPLEWLYRALLPFREPADRSPPVPVIVVGNLAVGGSGKTPLVLALLRAATARGLRVGVIARGHGGRGPFPLRVRPDTDPALCGDEPALIVRRHDVPFIVAPDRAAALASLLADAHPDLVISDDGLQHRALPRTFEIAVVDGRRGFGNGHCLPLGPLREPVARLQRVDAVVINGQPPAALAAAAGDATAMQLRPVLFRRVGSEETLTLEAARARFGERVTALAGIGDPARFFATLQSLGHVVDGHAFPDHHLFVAGDLRRFAGRPLLMTEKDAVKCVVPVRVTGIEAWYLQVDAVLPAEFFARVFARAGLPERS